MEKRRVIIRLLAGLYLIYIAYSILFTEDRAALTEHPILILFGIFFMVVAVLIVGLSWRDLKRIKTQEEKEAREIAERRYAEEQQLEEQQCVEEPHTEEQKALDE